MTEDGKIKKCLNCEYFSLWDGTCTRIDSGHLWEEVDHDFVCVKWEKEQVEG